MKKLLVTCLVIITVVSLTACGKNKDETKISNGYIDDNGDVYANQEVKEQTETDATETDATEAEETTESTSTKTDKESNIAEPLDMFYNVQQDPNALLVVDMFRNILNRYQLLVKKLVNLLKFIQLQLLDLVILYSYLSLTLMVNANCLK